MKKGLLIFIVISMCLWLVLLTYVVNTLPTDNTKENIDEYTVTGFSTDLSTIVDDNKSSVVSINNGEKVSTGFIYSKQEDKVYVVSTLHGVDNDDDIEVTLNSGLKIKGTIKNYDVYLDLALIECNLDSEVRPIVLGDSNLLKDGVFVVGVGTCGKEEYSFSSQFGMVSSKCRELENIVTYKNETYHYFATYIQLSGEFVEGYSGSPIFNMNGEVVGMVSLKDEEVVLATTINEIKLVVDKMIANEDYHHFNYGFSGKYVDELKNHEKANLNIGLETISGYYISNIKPGSFAANIGLNKGDVIVSINDYVISNHDSLLHVIYNNFDEYNIVVLRNNEKIKFEGLIND